MRSALALLLFVAGCAESKDKAAGDGKAEAKPKGPTAAKEGVEWTHRELLDHLKARGVQWERSWSMGDGLGWGPTIAIEATNPTGDLASAGHVVIVVLRPTAKNAREQAGTLPEPFFA